MCFNREVCRNEFIIPLGPELKELYSDEEMCHSLRSLLTESVRPQLRMTEIAYVKPTHNFPVVYPLLVPKILQTIHILFDNFSSSILFSMYLIVFVL